MGLTMLGSLVFGSIAAASFSVHSFDVSQKLSPSYIRVQMAAGTKATVPFAVSNSMESDGLFNIGIVDAMHTDEKDGFFSLKGVEDEQVSVGLWGSIPTDQVEVAADSYEILEITFEVPEDAVEGLYWGGVFASGAPSGNGSMTSIAQMGLRTSVEIVPMEEYVPIESVEIEKPKGEGGGLTIFYIISGILVIIFAGVIAINQTSTKKKK